MRPSPLALALWLVAPACARAAQVQSIPSLATPLAPSPALTQLRLDLAALQAPHLAGASPLLSPQAFARLSAVVQAPAAVAPAAPMPGAALSKTETDALARVELAQQVLGKFDAETFAKLPPGEQQAALDSLWDKWASKGLVASAEPLAAVDAAISQGVDDKALTSANKSIFLGAGVLGYPLEDSVWLSNTRIRDALEENALSYPAGQQWRTDDGTPEFLGTTKEGQDLVNAWGRAVDYARLLIKAVEAGSKTLPRSADVTPAAAAGFARLVAELKAGKDEAAVAYLRDRDPTFIAFLLDVRKPGYYLYNGDGSVVARIMAAQAAAALGVRRLDQKDGAVHASTYFYRPGRVAQRVSELAAAPGTRDTADYHRRLGPYARRLEDLTRALPAPAGSMAGFTFADAQFLPATALDSPANELASYPESGKGFSRYDLPITAQTVRDRRDQGYGALSDAQWRGLVAVYDASPALRAAAGPTSLRVVSQSYETRGKLIAPAKAPASGLTLQLHLLDRLAALEGKPEERASFLRFAAAAVQAALEK